MSEGLTSHEIDLVKSSWSDISKDGYAIYGINMMLKMLANPDLKPVFKFANGLNTAEEIRQSSRVRDHGEKIFDSVGQVVEYVTDGEYCEAILVGLGSAHHKYITKADYFRIVGQALIETLREGLKEKFTPETEKAWAKTYGYVQTQMQKGLDQSSKSNK